MYSFFLSENDLHESVASEQTEDGREGQLLGFTINVAKKGREFTVNLSPWQQSK